LSVLVANLMITTQFITLVTVLAPLVVRALLWQAYQSIKSKALRLFFQEGMASIQNCS